MLNLFSLWGRKTTKPADLKKQTPLEDVQRLYKEISLDPTGYRRFTPPSLPLEVVSRAEPDIPGKTGDRPAETSAHESMPHAVRTAGATDGQTQPETAPTDHEKEEHLPPTQLASATSETTTQSPDVPTPFSLLSLFAGSTFHAASADAPVVGFASYSGGVGKSTLSAALAMCLLTRNQRCLVLGETRYSPLPYYLGWTRPEADNADTVIHIRQTTEQSADTLNLFIGGTKSGALVDEARKTIPQADLILFDREASPNIDDELGDLDLVIVPIRPDVNALIIIERIDQALAQLKAPPKLGVFFVLNQYDDRKNLHREIRHTLARRLGKRLLDVVVPWDDSVQLALASGKTPQTLQSNSPFALATKKLCHWLEQITSLPQRA